jgi:hypothetical protein
MPNGLVVWMHLPLIRIPGCPEIKPQIAGDCGPHRRVYPTFDILMGDAVDPRKRFIQTHAKIARILDI